MRSDDVDRLLNASAARDYIFDNHEFLAVVDLKSAAQRQFFVFFLDENVTFAERPRDFLADDDPAEGRGDHRVAIEASQFIGEHPAHSLGDVGVLEKNRALKILATM